MPGVGTTHNVKIAGNYYLLRPGSYRKRPGPVFGARFATGDPDYNNLSFWQHWAQTCWVGGFGAETWMDDAMFDEGVGIDASQHEVMVLARDLGPQASRGTGNWNLDEGDSPRQGEFTVYNGKLYCLRFGDQDATPPSRLYVWTEGSSTWTLVKTFSTEVRTMEPFSGWLVFASRGANMERMDQAEAFSTFAKPAGMSEPGYTSRTYRGKYYVAFANFIWRLKPDFTWDGTTAFYTAEGLTHVDNVLALDYSDIHLGFLYFASKDGHILRTDGNNTFDIWQFEPSVLIRSIRSFDGRLFVATTEPLVGTTAQQSVLYQFTGSAITELKRWGRVGRDIEPGVMRVVGSRLFFGAPSLLGMSDADGFGVGMYDAAEDAYHLFASCQDATAFPGGTEGINWIVDDVMYFKGYIWALVRGYGVFRTLLSYSDVSRFQATYDTTAAGGSPGDTNGGYYESSDFDAGTPGLDKLWNAVTVHVDLPTTATSITLAYSIDGGQTWVEVDTLVGNGTDTRYAQTWALGVGNPLEGLRATRFKYRITLRTTNSTRSPQLRGVIVRYLPLPEPNWQWDMILIVSERQHLLDDTTAVLDESAIDAAIFAIEDAFRQQMPVNFIDVDGQNWTINDGAGVLVTDYVKEYGTIGPDSDGGHEAYLRISLLEAVEAY